MPLTGHDFDWPEAELAEQVSATQGRLAQARLVLGFGSRGVLDPGVFFFGGGFGTVEPPKRVFCFPVFYPPNGKPERKTYPDRGLESS